MPPSVVPAADVLVLAAHPDLRHSRVTRAMMRAAAAAGPRVALRDLYALYPDYLVDAAAERQALVAAKLVVWLHPMHWYGPTPMLKLWMDEVLGHGWAYGPGGRALAGKDLWLAVSTGGTDEAYRPVGHHRHFVDAFWPAYEQTAALTGMRWLPPLVLHGAHRADEAEIAAHATLFAERLRDWPAWPELADLDVCEPCADTAGERPIDTPA